MHLPSPSHEDMFSCARQEVGVWQKKAEVLDERKTDDDDNLVFYVSLTLFKSYWDDKRVMKGTVQGAPYRYQLPRMSARACGSIYRDEFCARQENEM